MKVSSGACSYKLKLSVTMAVTQYTIRAINQLRVSQGHIGLDTAVFPEGTPGFVIEAFARQPLWKDGLNYRHGTGHGVGAALNVHEVRSSTAG